ncbi:MAG: MOSC domain-containing protein [Blastocatellia bacterium]
MQPSTKLIIGVYVGAKRGEGKTAVESAELVADYGIRGDAHAGRDTHRQISLFEIEVLRELAAEGIEVSPESISANLITEGVNLNDLGPGACRRIGEAMIELAEARKPCGSLTKLDRRLPKRLYQRCGLMGRILKGGFVCPGAEVEPLSEPVGQEQFNPETT